MADDTKKKLDFFGFAGREVRNVWNKYVHNDTQSWQEGLFAKLL